MNITAKLVERIEAYRKTNKKPCKSYATEKAAEREGGRVAAKAAREFMIEDVGFVVFYNEPWGRWCVAFDLTRAMRHANGGYIGICGDHFTY